MAKKDEVTLQLLAVADQVIESKDGKKSLIGIFNRIFVQQLPATHQRMVLFMTLLGKDETQDTITFFVEKPSGQRMPESTFNFKYGNNGKADVIINMEGFPIEEVGDYSIIITREGKELGRYVIQVAKVQVQTANSTVVN